MEDAQEALTTEEEATGPFRMGVAHAKGRVILHFDRKVRWLSLTPSAAKELGQSLKAHGLLAKGTK